MPSFFQRRSFGTTSTSQPVGFSTADSTFVGAVRVCYAILGSFLLIILIKTASLQIIQHEHYAIMADENRSRIEPIPAERGMIFDRYGEQLLHNAADFQVQITQSQLSKNIQERRQVFFALADVLEVLPEDIESALDEFRIIPTLPVVIEAGLSQEQAVKIGVMAASTPGLELVSGMRRDYTSLKDTPSLSHVLGYTGRITKSEYDALRERGYAPSDVVGKSGIEKQYEDALRGVFGKRRIEIDARGNQKTVIAEELPTKGQDLTLTIDYELQKYTEKMAAELMKERGLRRASIIALSPMTGEVLTLVSLPGFDANAFVRGVSSVQYKALLDDPDRPLFPRATSGSLPSGSTFKLVVAAAALEEKLITTATTVLSVGGIRYGAWSFPDWKLSGHGVTNVYKAIAESVNSFFYIIGGGDETREGLGTDRIIAYGKKFGFGAPTGIDLPREGAGLLPTPEWKEKTKKERWYIGDTYHLAIGQGDLLVTPLQITTMTSVFANGGKLIRPSLLLGSSQNGRPKFSHEPNIVNPQVVSPETVAIVRRGMLETTKTGSARGQLGVLPYGVAAKTGTAEWRTGRAPHAWITTFAPYDKPQIAVTIVLEEGGQGSDLPQKMARLMIEWYLKERVGG
jgi:penicillin-binding protein 2